MFSPKSGCPDSCIGRQNIIYIIKSLIIRCNMSVLNRKRKLISYFYILCIKVRCWTLESAFRTLVITKLTVVIKTVLKSFPAAFAETSFSNFVCFIFHDRTTDSVINTCIATVLGKICRKSIITIYDQFHVRHFADHFFENIHGNIDLTVTIQLITEKIRHHHIIRFDLCKNMSGRCLINFNTGIICINMSIHSGAKCKRSHNTVQHIGSGVIADNFISFFLQCCTEHIIGSCLTIGSTDYKNVFSYFCSKLLQNRWIYF